MTIIEKALFVLQKTNDGDDLLAHRLGLVEMAFNDNLSDLGVEIFNRLYNDIKKDALKKEWFQGIENMTMDQEGFIYWKGQNVEHYEIPWAYTEKAYNSANELKRRCLYLESIDVRVNAVNTTWKWDEFSGEKACS